MAAHAAGEVRAAIVRASDFFGPGVERSILGLGAFRNVMAGKPVSCLGKPQLLHTLTYIEDFARAMVNVSETPECLGEVRHAPSSRAALAAGHGRADRARMQHRARPASSASLAVPGDGGVRPCHA